MRFYLIILLFLGHAQWLKAQKTKPENIRGIWLTAHHGVLDSRENIKAAVEQCKKAGINNIYVVTWNQGYTLYPSAVMMERFGIAIDPRFSQRDPLGELIEEAHAKKIKVHAWFEFGFAAAYGDSGMHILKKFPYYAAIGPDGRPVEKNGFRWMNGFHPLVQNFIKSLVLEVVERYPIDGIQGDDRLPALPSTAGYDPFTIRAYQKAHNGLTPPRNPLDSNWVQWRAKQLNQFAKQLFTAVKKLKPGITVSMAPSIYPWSLQEYLQDWPTWLREGYVDYVIVQLYRYQVDAYEKILQESIQAAGPHKDKLYAGVLSSLANGYLAKPELLEAFHQLNQKYDLPGEVYFYYGGLSQQLDYFKRLKSK